VIKLYGAPDGIIENPTMIHFYNVNRNNEHILCISVSGEVDIRHSQQEVVKVVIASPTCYDVYIRK
jgi:hypothetical protein